jgi:hypothetical protein
MPFYAKRRIDPLKDGVHMVEDVTKLYVKGSTCMEETRALVYYLYDRGVRLICVSGTSMGSVCANLVIGLLDIPVANFGFLSSDSLSGFWQGICSKSADWETLSKTIPKGGYEDIAFERTKTFVYDFMEKYCSNNSFPKPIADDCSI